MNYGQHNSNLERIKAKLGRISSYTHTQDFSTHKAQPDCISCLKNKLNRIPNTPQCQAICGDNKHTKRVYNKTGNKSKLTRAEHKPINKLKNTFPEISND
jgi:hypothetical protein